MRVFLLPFVPSPITSPSAAEAAQRLRLDEEQEVARPREARFVTLANLTRQSRAMVFA